MRGDARRASEPAARARSLDGERFLDESLRRGDQLRHALLGVREDRVAAAGQAESFLGDGEGAVEPEVGPGRRLPPCLGGWGGVLQGRLFCPGFPFFWVT